MMNTPSTALITGGAVRVGKSIALCLAKQGCNIALHYNTSKEDAEHTAKQIRDLGVECTLFCCDLSDPTATKHLVKQVKNTFSSLNILINNASIFEKCDLQNTTGDIFDRHMNINAKAPLILTQEFTKHCKNGNIINMLDTYITRNETAYAAYLLSKKTLFDITKMSAKTLGPHIRVNGISIASTLPSAQWSQQDIERHSTTLPLGAAPNLTDITNGILYLLDNASTTGQSLFIDSGQHLI